MTLLCTYTYDPLDRIATLSLLAQALTQRFYCNGRMTTERQGDLTRTLFQADTHLLAQLNREGNDSAADLIVTDTQNSALGVTTAAQQIDIAYSPYGHRDPDLFGTALPGFTGAQPERVTGHYLLGNGYRAFNPTLMRFNSPDSLSPFGKGGLNAYAYCAGNPVNRIDPTGHMSFSSLGVIAGLILTATGVASAVVGGVTKDSNPELSSPLMIAGIVAAVLGVGVAGGSVIAKTAASRPSVLRVESGARVSPNRRGGVSGPPRLQGNGRRSSNPYSSNGRVSSHQPDRSPPSFDLESPPPTYEDVVNYKLPLPSYEEVTQTQAGSIVFSSHQIRNSSQV
ncbi:RHS repeat-associated core domain-containing protein [Pseudomonas alliivorans]|nr:RHS repeat-associated core domain-containing protein [Pseudomonas alliivorans]MEE4744758.1 RHS repeat-associated core domain-containing protein [Pseudomonas alliivorans]MEE5146354.1 RHS repeat-associated core domain-containing protein [Pseudomonas alliivorans]